MNPIIGILRVRLDQGVQLVHVGGDESQVDLARSLIEGAAGAAADAMQEAGVYRLRIAGEAHDPELSVARLAEAHESVAVAEVLRDGEESVAIRRLSLSEGEGQQLDEQQVEIALSEGVASATGQIPLGEQRTVEIVIP